MRSRSVRLRPAPLLCTLWLFAGCVGNTPGNQSGLPDAAPDVGVIPDATTSYRDAATDDSTGVIQVQLMDLSGDPVTDASVIADDVAVGSTDANGVFCVRDVAAPTSVKIRTRSATCSSAGRTVWVAPDQAVSMRLRCKRLTSTVLQNPGVGGTVAGPDGFSITITAGSFASPGGPVTGPVDVQYAIVNRADQMAAAPGDMLAAEGGGDPVQLQSWGMVEVKFSQGGQRLTFEGEAELVLPLDPAVPFGHGQTVGLYHFDETTGHWQQQGFGTVDTQLTGAPVFVATVTHFSWWNCDEPITDKSCLEGRLLYPSGDPVMGAQIRVEGVDYNTSLVTHTGASGRFCVTVKRDSLNRLAVWHAGDGSVHVGDATAVQAGSTPTDCNQGGCVDLGDLHVTSASGFGICE